MGTPTLPSYLGTYSELLHALLLNPFLGSGHKHLTADETAYMEIRTKGGKSLDVEEPAGQSSSSPWPSPWREASSLLLGAIGAKQTSSGGAASGAIARLVDDFCGTPPRPLPWWLLTAAQMGSLGENMNSGALKNDVLLAAGLLIQKTLGIGSAGGSEA